MRVRSIGFIKPIIRKCSFEQDDDSLIQGHISNESCNVIGDQNITFINGKVADFISKIKGIVNCVIVNVKCFQFFFKPLAELSYNCTFRCQIKWASYSTWLCESWEGRRDVQAWSSSERVYLQFPQAILHAALYATFSLSEGAVSVFRR